MINQILEITKNNNLNVDTKSNYKFNLKDISSNELFNNNNTYDIIQFILTYCKEFKMKETILFYHQKNNFDVQPDQINMLEINSALFEDVQDTDYDDEQFDQNCGKCLVDEVYQILHQMRSVELDENMESYHKQITSLVQQINIIPEYNHIKKNCILFYSINKINGESTVSPLIIFY